MRENFADGTVIEPVTFELATYETWKNLLVVHYWPQAHQLAVIVRTVIKST